MANNNKISYDKQIEFKGKAYLDSKAMPVEKKSGLNSLTQGNNKAFDGMEKVVLHDETQGNKMTKYVYTNNAWELVSPTISGDDVEM